MGHVHLMHQRYPKVWYLLEEGVDDISAWYDGKPSIHNTDCIYSAESLWDMLHQMQDNKDWRFYVVISWIDSKHRWRDQEYPQHRHICSIAGFVPDVCDIRYDDRCYFVDWEVCFCRELWISPDDEHIFKVRHWKEKAEKAVLDYIEENHFVWEDA